MKLYYSPNLNPRVAVAVAKHLKAPLEFVRADPQNPANTAAFLPLNPNALLPVLQEDDGSTLWEVDAIACRLSMVAGSNFWRMDAQMPDMVRWVSWSAYHLIAEGGTVYFDRLICPKYSIPRLSPRRVERAVEKFAEYLAIVDQALKDKAWLVGDMLSYADFRVATCLPFAKEADLPLAEFANVARWHNQLMELEAWRDPMAGLEL